MIKISPLIYQSGCNVCTLRDDEWNHSLLLVFITEEAFILFNFTKHSNILFSETVIVQFYLPTNLPTNATFCFKRCLSKCWHDFIFCGPFDRNIKTNKRNMTYKERHQMAYQTEQNYCFGDWVKINAQNPSFTCQVRNDIKCKQHMGSKIIKSKRNKRRLDSSMISHVLSCSA